MEEAAKRGKTNTALSAMEGQRKARAGSLVSETRLATLKGRARLPGRPKAPARDRNAPIRYVAELLRDGEDSKRAIRWLIALMVLLLWFTCHRIDSRGFDMAINHVLSERLVHLRPLRQ
jgi:hypothetical protein